MDIQKEKREIIEMFGMHFEKVYNTPPLASRLLANLILDCNGLTFEELMDRTAASKSSVSTNLNLLLNINKINYFTLPGDRKKYFRPAPLSHRLEKYQQMVELEKKVLEKILRYREETMASPLEIRALENEKAYHQHVLKVEELLKKTILKFRDIERDNNDK